MEAISEEFVIHTAVTYRDVDRDELLSLRGLAAHLQEAAIRHADQCGAGAQAKTSRGEAWVLHRMVVGVKRYPRYEEALRVVTWSAGIRTFKGFRDSRIYCGEELVASASSLWLYFSLAQKAITRVPADVAAGFPRGRGSVFFEDLDGLRMAPPAAGSQGREVSVRYSDFDGNQHVNNTVYFDYLQTALAAAGLPPRPGRVSIQFSREITPAVGQVKVCLEPRGPETAFGLGEASAPFAHGLVG